MNYDHTLVDLGYDEGLEEFRVSHNLIAFECARVVAEHRERYAVKNDKGEYEAEVLGIMRFNAQNRSDFPAVGDWVAIKTYDEKFAIIHHIFPRKTVLERQAVGKFGEKQIIAANIDFAFIVLASDRDFNMNRLERYLTLCHSSQIIPVILLSKTDLINPDDLELKLNILKSRTREVEVIAISNQTRYGYDVLKLALQKGKTFCLLGSSGTGKSTLINSLIGKEKLKTTVLSSSTGKGKHTTSHRELFILEEGGMIIDNPGMREVGITESTEGVESTFDPIIRLSAKCRYANCSHIHEKGCAVVAAVENKMLDRAFYQNYLKIEREKEHFQSTALEKRKKDREFGKMVKEVMNFRKQNKPF